MYYEESSQLIEQHPHDKDAIRMLDRTIAHVYAPGGSAYIEESLLLHQTGQARTSVKRLMGLYESSGIADSYERVECPCGEQYDPDEMSCGNCGEAVTAAAPTGQFCYRVLKQPAEPSFAPSPLSAPADIFISYRREDCSRLAADIYYSIRQAGHTVFFDNGSIPPGADPETMFLKAASEAKYFIALVSKSYFDSQFCKREIAHAARRKNRLLRINVPPAPSGPSDMPWIDGPNWIRLNGTNEGLTPRLEKELLTYVTIQAAAGTISDLRNEACAFLLEQLSLQDLDRVWNRLPWLREIRQERSKPAVIQQILEGVTTRNVDVLCNALAP